MKNIYVTLKILLNNILENNVLSLLDVSGFNYNLLNLNKWNSKVGEQRNLTEEIDKKEGKKKKAIFGSIFYLNEWEWLSL